MSPRLPVTLTDALIETEPCAGVTAVSNSGINYSAHYIINSNLYLSFPSKIRNTHIFKEHP